MTEHDKDIVYISTGFKNWKKALKCFKSHKATLTNQVIVYKCGNIAELINKDLLKQRSNERQHLKVVMKCLQFLACQGVALPGNDDDVGQQQQFNPDLDV